MKIPDTIFYNGPVHTVNQNNQICEAVAVSDNRITAVGCRDEILALADQSTRKIDLKGRSLIPGIIDSHLHTAVFGANAMAIDLRSPNVTSIADIKDLIHEAALHTPKGQWIRGWGYDHSKLKEKRHPNRWDLDAVAPDHPVMLTRVCAHISTHNSRSLELAGIHDDSQAPDGGAFERIDGVISGVMLENAHMNMMKVASLSKEELVKAMETASQMLVRQGVTSVHDSGGYGAVQMAAIQEAIESGKLKLRLNAMIFSFVENVKFVEEYLNIGVRTTFGNDRFQLGPIKLMIDGSSSGPTAATMEPYESNPGDCGIMSMEQAQIDDIVLRAHQGGWQMTCHAVGDRAIDSILNALSRALTLYPRENHRHRIEHAAMMNPELLQRIKQLHIIPVPQPIFLYEFGDGYLRNYGTKRANWMFPSRSFFESEIPAAGSSDCPITFSDPFLNMHTAMNRTTQTGAVLNDGETIDLHQALRMFTYNGAYASFEEEKKGSIEVGKLADLVVVSEDLQKVPREKMKEVTAELTMIDGEIVWQSE